MASATTRRTRSRHALPKSFAASARTLIPSFEHIASARARSRAAVKAPPAATRIARVSPRGAPDAVLAPRAPVDDFGRRARFLFASTSDVVVATVASTLRARAIDDLFSSSVSTDGRPSRPSRPSRLSRASRASRAAFASALVAAACARAASITPPSVARNISCSAIDRESFPNAAMAHASTRSRGMIPRARPSTHAARISRQYGVLFTAPPRARERASRMSPNRSRAPVGGRHDVAMTPRREDGRRGRARHCRTSSAARDGDGDGAVDGAVDDDGGDDDGGAVDDGSRGTARARARREETRAHRDEGGSHER